MGNYYKGEIILNIKNNIPKDIKNFLINLYILKETNLPYEKMLKLKNCLTKNEDLENIVNNCSFNILIDFQENVNVEQYDFNTLETIISYENMEEYLEKELYEILTFDKISTLLNSKNNFRLIINYSNKGYNNEIEFIINMFKPYLIENHENFLGRIYDEDGLKDDYFYLDYDVFLKNKKNCDYICNNCINRPEKSLCYLFKYCERAYNLGFNKKMRSNW